MIGFPAVSSLFEYICSLIGHEVQDSSVFIWAALEMTLSRLFRNKVIELDDATELNQGLFHLFIS